MAMAYSPHTATATIINENERGLAEDILKLVNLRDFLIFSGWTLIMAKKINHRGHGGHRELLFSLCPLCSLWFPKPIPEDNKKSQISWFHRRGGASETDRT
uniref:Uncharacterized protein n=1 Tax=Candidatus Methanogaster sp. ANME-2c ERB4 TaxID=2759911 RepID=A0A7G9YEX9_9EURY|nr:hypothetical protein BHHJPBMP_00010 [Methanosarcinales archaeon ANME-2c ERB4]